MEAMVKYTLPAKALAATLAAASCLIFAPRPAAADGAASTRNIIFGAAAATAGTLLIINHNKKVHEKYAEYDRQQAATAAQRNEAEAAYESERQAYSHEASLVSEYRKETNYQHAQIKARDKEIASLRHSLVVAKSGSGRAGGSFVQQAAAGAPAVRTVSSNSSDARPTQIATYGWGQF